MFDVQRHPEPITFLHLRSLHHFDICVLAWYADPNPKPLAHDIKALELVIYKMLLNEPVKREQALQILAVLPRLIGAEYTIDMLDIKLL